MKKAKLTRMERLCERVSKKIDESNFSRDLRYKCFSVKPDGGRIVVDWESQGYCDRHADFNRELKRAARASGFAGRMKVILRDRDGFDSFAYTLDVKPGPVLDEKSALRKVRKILAAVDKYDDPLDAEFAIAKAVYGGGMPENLVEHFEEYGITGQAKTA